MNFFQSSCNVKSDIKLKNLRFVAIDLETTGVKKSDKVISVGAVAVENGIINEKKTFYELLNPQKTIPHEITRLTGISDEMLKNKPTFADILPALLSWIGDSILVGHVIHFDLIFLNTCLREKGLKKLKHKTFDTQELMISLHPHLINRQLEEICAYLGLEVKERHHALGDAIMSANILTYAITQFSKFGIFTLGDLDIYLRNRQLTMPAFSYMRF